MSQLTAFNTPFNVAESHVSTPPKPTPLEMLSSVKDICNVKMMSCSVRNVSKEPCLANQRLLMSR